MVQDKILEVRAIENGTVIDHIPSAEVFKIIDILGLEQDTNRMTIGINLESKRLGSKAIIKINDRYCKQEEINRIAIVAPQAVVNIIKNFEVIDKLKVTIPERIEGFVRCANPRCVTNNEVVSTSFHVTQSAEGISLKCRYCEKTTYQKQIELVR